MFRVEETWSQWLDHLLTLLKEIPRARTQTYQCPRLHLPGERLEARLLFYPRLFRSDSFLETVEARREYDRIFDHRTPDA